jgi:hypothetical protein
MVKGWEKARVHYSHNTFAPLPLCPWVTKEASWQIQIPDVPYLEFIRSVECSRSPKGSCAGLQSIAKLEVVGF